MPVSQQLLESDVIKDLHERLRFANETVSLLTDQNLKLQENSVDIGILS